jgi:hypothetical protein
MKEIPNESLVSLVVCKELLSLGLAHRRYFTIADSLAFTKTLHSWTRLTTLWIKGVEDDTEGLGLTPNESCTYTGSGVDISVLGLLARHLPKLKQLDVSLLACDTSILESDIFSIHSNLSNG